MKNHRYFGALVLLVACHGTQTAATPSAATPSAATPSAATPSAATPSAAPTLPPSRAAAASGNDAPPSFLLVATNSTVVFATGKEPVRFARPRPKLPLVVRGDAENGAGVAVEITGGIELTGVVARDGLGVLACEAGPIGAHFYAGAQNLLRLLPGAPGPSVKVAGEVLLIAGARQGATASGVQKLSFEAEIPAARLCKQAPPPRHAGTSNDPIVLQRVGEVDADDFGANAHVIEIEKGVAMTLLDKPGGAPLYTRPADTWGFNLVQLRREGNWDLVAAGSGPYVIGWIPAQRPPAPASTGGLGLVGDLINTSPTLLASSELSGLPLHELAAGSEIEPLSPAPSMSHARLTQPGFARVRSLRNGSAEVVVAVNDDVVVEGRIDAKRLGRRVKERR